MVIAYKDDFFETLANIRNFIAKDSVSRADDFTKNLHIQIEKIPSMPYSFRQNLDADNKQVRDLIFKGYVIPFHINEKTDTITIFFIYKENLPKIDFKSL